MNTKTAEIKSKIPNITNFTAKSGLNKKVTEKELKKIVDTRVFISTPEFIRLEKICLDAIIKGATKTLAVKIQVDNALDVAYKK